MASRHHRRAAGGARRGQPAGVAVSPTNFGFGGALLVGFSFAVSEIDAFDPLTDAYPGTIADRLGDPSIASRLGAIAFGNGVGGSAGTLCLNAGIDGERDGRFGAISAIPEPDTAWLFVAELGAVRLGKRRRPA